MDEQSNETEGLGIGDVFSALRGYCIDWRDAKALMLVQRLEERFREDYKDCE